MGMLTDLIIAEPEMAQTIVQEYPQQQEWPVLQLKGVDNAALAALALAWGDTKLAETLEDGKGFIGERDGPWVIVVPDRFRDRLAAVRTEDIPDLAGVWITQGDMPYGGWEKSDVEALLPELRNFAVEAVKLGKPLILWMSL